MNSIKAIRLVALFTYVVSAFWLNAHAQSASEKIFWDSVDCTDESQVRSYLEAYPTGAYTDYAIECIKADGEESQINITLESALQICEGHMRAKRLTSGIGGTAFNCYQEILEYEPGNSAALAGLRKIENTYAKWSQSSINRGRISNARINLEKLRRLNPAHPQVPVLQSTIDGLESPAVSTVVVEEPTTIAVTQSVSSNSIATVDYTRCDGLFEKMKLRVKDSSALECYLSLLSKLDGSNKSQALERVSGKYIKMINFSLYRNNYFLGAKYLNQTWELNPENQELGDLRERLITKLYSAGGAEGNSPIEYVELYTPVTK